MIVFIGVHKHKQNLMTTAILTDKDQVIDMGMQIIKDWKCTLNDVDMYIATKKVRIGINIEDIDEDQN